MISCHRIYDAHNASAIMWWIYAYQAHARWPFHPFVHGKHVSTCQKHSSLWMSVHCRNTHLLCSAILTPFSPSSCIGILGPIAYAQGAAMDGWGGWMTNGLLLLAAFMTGVRTGPNSIACTAYLSIERPTPFMAGATAV